MGTLTTASPICSSPQLPSVGRCHGSMIQLPARPVGLCARAHLQARPMRLYGRSMKQLPARPVGLCARAHLRARPMRLSGRFSLHEGSNPSTASSSHMQYDSVTCAAAALSARSEAEQTQTVISKDPTIIHLPGEKISPTRDILLGSTHGGWFLWRLPGWRLILCSRLGLWLFGLSAMIKKKVKDVAGTIGESETVIEEIGWSI